MNKPLTTTGFLAVVFSIVLVASLAYLSGCSTDQPQQDVTSICEDASEVWD